MASWSSFDEFESIIKSYTPSYGEGNIMSEQIVTAINKLIYKWFNDGDVYDNRYFMQGWCNDLSSYANWLYEYVNLTELDEIETVKGDEEYSNLLFKVARKCLNEDYLKQYKKEPRKGSIYEATGPFEFSEYEEDEDGEDEYED